MDFDYIGDRLEYYMAKPVSFGLFLLWCVAMPFINTDVANYGISVLTALLLVITLGSTRKDRKAVHIKLDDLEESLDCADSSKAGIEKRLEDE